MIGAEGSSVEAAVITSTIFPYSLNIDVWFHILQLYLNMILVIILAYIL